jgi:large subunit ribosomal protein L21
VKYAVVKIGGSQYKVAEGEMLAVAKLEGKKGQELKFEEVLLLVDEKKTLLGQPKVEGAKVKAEIVEQLKGKKIRVATYKAKSRYRRVKGFRPLLTRVKILSII